MKSTALKIFYGIVAAAAVAGAVYLLMPRMAVMFAERYGGVDISYDKWTGNPLDRSSIKGLTLILKGRGIIVKEDSADLDVDLGAGKMFSDRAVNIICDMKGVAFNIPEASGSGVGGDILALSFSPTVQYDSIDLKIRYAKEAVYLYDFSADSDSIRMAGSCNYFRKGDYLELLLHISVSSDVYNSLPEQIRSTALTAEDDGWYGTVIDIKAPWKIFQFMSSLPVL